MKRGDPRRPKSAAPKPKPIPRKKAPPTPPEKLAKLHAYLDAIARGARHKEAAVETGVRFADIRLEYTHNPEFLAKYKKAEEDREIVWKNEHYDETHHRAVVGVPRSVTCGAGVCGTDYIPSDRLMEVLLRKDHPEWFENRVKAEHNVAPPLVELLMHLEQTIPQGSGSAKKSEG